MHSEQVDHDISRQNGNFKTAMEVFNPDFFSTKFFIKIDIGPPFSQP